MASCDYMASCNIFHVLQGSRETRGAFFVATMWAAPVMAMLVYKSHENYSYLHIINQFVTLELCSPQLNAIENGGPTSYVPHICRVRNKSRPHIGLLLTALRQLSLVRLFNCEMFFGEMELQLLEQELNEVPTGSTWRIFLHFVFLVIDMGLSGNRVYSQ